MQYKLHFTSEETETQRDQVAFPEADHSWLEEEVLSNLPCPFPSPSLSLTLHKNNKRFRTLKKARIQGMLARCALGGKLREMLSMLEERLGAIKLPGVPEKTGSDRQGQ